MRISNALYLSVLLLLVSWSLFGAEGTNSPSPLDKLPQGGPWILEERDLLHPEALAIELLSQRESISVYIWEHVPKETRDLLREFQSSGHKGDWQIWNLRLSRALVPVLNQVIQGESLHSKIPSTPEEKDTRMLRAQNPTGDALTHLNRMILEDAFTYQISRSVRLTFDEKGHRFAVVDNHQRTIAFYRDDGTEISTCFMGEKPTKNGGNSLRPKAKRASNIGIHFRGKEVVAMFGREWTTINIETGANSGLESD